MKTPTITNNSYAYNTYNNFKNESKGKKCILYGINKHMENIIYAIKNDVEIAFIIDNDSTKWGSKIFGFEIKPPKYLCELNIKDVIILVTTIHIGSVENILISTGFSYYSFFLFFDIAIHLDFYDSVFIMFKNSYLL